MTNDVLTVMDLAVAFRSPNHLAYRNMLRDTGISSEFQRKLFQEKEKVNYDKFLERHAELSKIVKSAIDEYQENIGDYEKTLEILEQRIKEVETRLDYLRQTAGEIKAKLQKNRNDKDELEKQEKRLEQMKRYTLVHPTASITAIDKRRDTTIIVSQYDADSMGFDRFADLVIDSEEYCDQEDLVICKGVQKFNSKEEEMSAIMYVSLVFEFWANDKPFDLLYNHEGIKYILDNLGIF